MREKPRGFAAHDDREELQLASRIGLLHNGTLELVTTPGEFRRAQTAEAEAFLAVLDEKPPV